MSLCRICRDCVCRKLLFEERHTLVSTRFVLQSDVYALRAVIDAVRFRMLQIDCPAFRRVSYELSHIQGIVRQSCMAMHEYFKVSCISTRQFNFSCVLEYKHLLETIHSLASLSATKRSALNIPRHVHSAITLELLNMLSLDSKLSDSVSALIVASSKNRQGTASLCRHLRRAFF